MTISSLVITLVDNTLLRSQVLRSLARDARLSLGEPVGAKVPVVAETMSLEAGRRLFQDLRDEAGVEYVDVVSIHFEDESDQGE